MSEEVHPTSAWSHPALHVGTQVCALRRKATGPLDLRSAEAALEAGFLGLVLFLC